MEADKVVMPAGLECRKLRAGGTYVKLHHFADPEKWEAWLDLVRREMADTPREFEVEILMKELLLDGLPVYGGFVEAVHAPLALSTRTLECDASSRFIMGWDCGTGSVEPAAILLEVTLARPNLGIMVRALMEITAQPSTSMEAFTPAVLESVAHAYPQVNLGSVVHAGDETGRNRQGATGESAFQVMARYGVFCQPVSNAWQLRRSSVDRLLSREAAPGVPMLLVNRSLCPTLTDGFLGGYRLRQTTQGSSILYGEPIKDRYSHVHDALQYAAVLAWSFLEGEPVSRFTRRTGRARKRIDDEA